jgi:hypothetical protein
MAETTARLTPMAYLNAEGSLDFEPLLFVGTVIQKTTTTTTK